MELKVQYRQDHFKNFFIFVLGIWVKNIYIMTYSARILRYFFSLKDLILKLWENRPFAIKFWSRKTLCYDEFGMEKKHLISKVTDSFGKLFNKSVVYSRGTAEWVRNKFWPLRWRISLAKIPTTPIET